MGYKPKLTISGPVFGQYVVHSLGTRCPLLKTSRSWLYVSHESSWSNVIPTSVLFRAYWGTVRTCWELWEHCSSCQPFWSEQLSRNKSWRWSSSLTTLMTLWVLPSGAYVKSSHLKYLSEVQSLLFLLPSTLLLSTLSLRSCPTKCRSIHLSSTFMLISLDSGERNWLN